MSIKLTFFLLSFQVGFMTGPRPMTLHFILVASVSCWEVLFCCWQPCLPGIHAKSNSPSQLRQPFYTKLPLIPLMFRRILEGTKDCFHTAKFHCVWSEWLFFYISFMYCICRLDLLYFLSPPPFPKKLDYSVLLLFMSCGYCEHFGQPQKTFSERNIISLQTPIVPLQGSQRRLCYFKTDAGSMMSYVWRPPGTKTLSSLC